MFILQRQLDSEKQKTASKRAVQKMEMLHNKKEQVNIIQSRFLFWAG